MKNAVIKIDNHVTVLSSEYLNQQTCCSSVFENVPLDVFSQDELIDINKKNRNFTWWKESHRDDRPNTWHLNIPSDMIEWEDEKDNDMED